MKTRLLILAVSLLNMFALISCEEVFAPDDPANIVISKYEIVVDNNNNQKANPGETIGIAVYLKNTGDNDAKDVEITEINLLSGYLTEEYFYPSNLKFGNILSGQEKTDSDTDENYTIKISINKSIPVDAVYNILLTMKDAEGATWNDTLKLPVEKTGADIVLSKYEIVGDNNNNAKANPGEELEIAIYLKNIGIDKANDVEITEINLLSGYLTKEYFYPSNLKFGNILSGQEKTDSDTHENYTIKISINNSIPVDAVYNILLTMKDGEGATWIDTLKLPVEKTGADIILSKHEIVGDNNNNAKANPGEELEIAIYLKNIGIDKANDVEITEINLLSGHLTKEYYYPSNLKFGNILSGQEKTDLDKNDNYTIKVSVSSNAPYGGKEQIQLKIQDAEGNTWEEILELTIE